VVVVVVLLLILLFLFQNVATLRQWKIDIIAWIDHCTMIALFALR